MDPADVARILDEDPAIVACIMCHHETSVGLLNPVHEIGNLCRKRDKMFFVDAVSSLGGEDLDVRRDKIDVLISSANKCLHAISGVSFVCINNRIWPRIEEIPPRVYYLNLKRYHHISSSVAQTPFTPAVSNFFALDAALDELLKEGTVHRIRHYRTINRRIRKAFRRMGLEQFTATGHESNTITTLRVPDYIVFADLYEEMKSRGYIIYNCKEHLENRYFQIANMGELSDEMIQGFLDSLALVLKLGQQRLAPRAEVQRATEAATSVMH
jgi:2-aminoethylphosphonate-pyruvate transaminase